MVIKCEFCQTGDCEYCSYNDKCILIKPFSKKLHELEVKRFELEKENNKLRRYIFSWDEVEKNLDKYGVNSVTNVIYFNRTKQQMLDRINDNKRLIEAYLNKEKTLL